MDKYIMFVKDGKITIQEADYIEDGWYVEVIGGRITLYEIPLHGGKERTIGTYNTILDAINTGNALT